MLPQAPTRAAKNPAAPAAASDASSSAADDDTALPAVGKVWEGAGPTSVFAAFKKAGAARPAAAPAQAPTAQAPNPIPIWAG